MTDDPVIELMIQNEEALARLYGTFARKLPAMKPFWIEMVREERAHAEILRVLTEKLRKKEVTIASRRPDPAAIRTAVSYVVRQAAALGQETITPIRALSLSLDIERTMIEKDFFTAYEPGSDMMRSEFRQLREHTEAHIRRLQEQLEDVRTADGA